MLIDNTIPVITDVSTDASDSGDLLRIAAILLIVVGGLLFIISLLGTIGAIIEHKVILGVVRTPSFFDGRFHFYPTNASVRFVG